jgi:zinc transport system substrate-binding protein
VSIRSLATGLTALALLACPGPAPEDPRPLVLASVLPHTFVVDRIAGGRVRAEAVIPPGASHSTYAPTLAQLQALASARLYVKVGHPSFPFEQAWLDRILAEAPDLVVVDASEGLDLRAGDPHVWLAPRHVEHLAIALEAALGRLLPEHRAEFARNLAAFRAEIAALDAEIREALAPVRGRRFVVFHPAWGYFAEEYGLEQVAIEHERKEPDTRELAELLEMARREKVEVVFVQPQFSDASARVIAREIGARVEVLDPLAYDWDANLRRTAQALAAGLSG